MKFSQTLWNILTFRVRILPIVIFCGCMMLTVKVAQLFQKVGNDESSSWIDLSSVTAQENSPSEKVPQTLTSTPPPLSSPSEKTTVASSEKKENIPISSQNAQGPRLPENAQAQTNFSTLDPLKMSPEEFKTLQELGKREKKLEQQERELPEQKATHKAIEAQIEKKVQELNSAQAELKSLLSKVEEKENSNIARLVKMSENMKPKEAAKILEGVEFEILVEIMERIKEAKASDILMNMEPQKASYLMTELATRKKVFKKDGKK